MIIFKLYTASSISLEMILLLITLIAKSCATDLIFPNVSSMDPKIIAERRRDFKSVHFNMVLVGPKNYVLPEIYKTQGSLYYNYAPKSDDIYLVHFPKAGISWFSEVVWLLVNKLDFKTAKSTPINKRVHWLDEKLAMNQSVTQLPTESIPPVRIIRTTLPFSLIPNILNSPNKVIYMARNPKDTIADFFTEVKNSSKFNFVRDIARYFYYFGNSFLIYTPYWSHVQEGFFQRLNKTKLFLYSDENSLVLIKSISTFLGTTYTEEQLNQVVSFMEQQPQIQKQMWKNVFSAEVNKQINEWIHKNVGDMKFPNMDIYS